MCDDSAKGSAHPVPVLGTSMDSEAGHVKESLDADHKNSASEMPVVVEKEPLAKDISHSTFLGHVAHDCSIVEHTHLF
jgi:hypothetical protein